MVTGEILLGIPYYWYYRHYTTPSYSQYYSLYKYTLLLVLRVGRSWGSQGIGY